MARRKTKYDPSKHDFFVIAAALLTSLGFTQKAIEKHLGISQALVSELISEAKDRGWLAKYLPFYPEAEGLTAERIAQAKNLWIADHPLEKHLAKLQTRPVAFKLAVFPSDQIEFAKGAAHYVAELLERSQLIGVGYGRTLKQLVKEIGEITRGDKKRFANKLCVPLCGSPTNLLSQTEEKYASSVLSTELQEAFTGKTISGLPSLTGVPAYMPRMYGSKDDRATLENKTAPDANRRPGVHSPKDYVYSIKGYQQIFGGDQNSAGEPYLQRIDTLLTGLGVVAPEGDCGEFTTGTFIRERIAAEQSSDVTVETLRKIIHGDIAGILVQREHIREHSDEWRLVEELNRGWIGLCMHDLVQIADKAQEGGAPGVIVATVVHSKSEALIAARAAMIKEIVRRGLVNHLIISQNLADALHSDFPEIAPPARRPERKKRKVINCV